MSNVCVCVCTCTHAHTQLCLTLCDSMDYSLPGASVHGIIQGRILEWVAISSSRGSLWCVCVLVAQSCLTVTPWTVAH